jgi:flagellar assembly protein FliH
MPFPARRRGGGGFDGLDPTASLVSGEASSPHEGLDPQGAGCAERLVAEARRRADQIEREAFAKGFAEGERAGRALAEQSMESSLRALDGALEAWLASREERSREQVQEVVRLSLAVAERILHREVRTDPRVVTDVVTAALHRGQLGEEVVVRVNPMDRETLMAARPEMIGHLGEVRSMRIEADEGIERGGALVECALGELDLRLGRQLEEIAKAFARLWVDPTGTLPPGQGAPAQSGAEGGP